MCLNLNSILILLWVLRFTITILRRKGFGGYLPLDDNIYLHKICGVVIFLQAIIHGTMHLINLGKWHYLWVFPYLRFIKIRLQIQSVICNELVENFAALNVVPDPVRFVQVNQEFLSNLNYKSPPDCQVTKNWSNNTVQICSNSTENWSYLEWTFTAKPNCFGLIAGIANPTGVALTLVLVTMCIFSIPSVRQSGHFEVLFSPKTFIHTIKTNKTNV